MVAEYSIQTMIKGVSEETRKMLVNMEGVLNEPHLFPKEVVDALKTITPDDPVDLKKMYGINGYVIYDMGYVGIRPEASTEAKAEWMNFWRACRSADMGIL
ncbi:MAG: hypothetical protein FWC44_03115 [Methanomassiliicoccaceae archaeon]|nr:hypothetical protein [Methanomassiliicoccaceae archaeon]